MQKPPSKSRLKREQTNKPKIQNLHLVHSLEIRNLLKLFQGGGGTILGVWVFPET